MKNKKLISMLLLPAALVACTNDDFINEFESAKPADGNLVENVILNVSMADNAATRGAFAGATDGVFQNFYMEPEFAEANGADIAAGEIVLSDNTAFYGDMVGLALPNGGSAVTNLPYYVAGYYGISSEAREDDTTIYPFVAQSASISNPLYDLSVWGTDALKEGYVQVDSLTDVKGSVTPKATFEASVARISNLAKNADMPAHATDSRLDVRKAIMRSNFPIMAGNYVAYYPYNKDFVNAGGVPVKALSAIKNFGSALSDNVQAAIKQADFKDDLFAMSNSTVAIKPGIESTEISLVPVTSAMVFRVFNTSAEDADISVKLITVRTKEPATTDFALTGTMTLGAAGAANSFTVGAEDKTTDVVGVAFTATAISKNGVRPAAGVTEANCKYAVIPCYPNSTKELIVSVYKEDNTVAEFEIPGYVARGEAATFNLDLKGKDFVPAKMVVYNKASFKEVVEDFGTAGGTVVLLSDIEIGTNDLTGNQINVPLTVEGNGELTLKNITLAKKLTSTGVLNLESVTVSDELDCTEEGSVLTLKNCTVADGKAVKAETLNIDGTTDARGTAVTATTLNVLGGTVSFNETAIGTLNNAGTVEVYTIADSEKRVNVTTKVVNNAILNVKIGGELIAAAIENNAGAKLNVSGVLTAETITNAAEVTGDAPKAAAKITIGANASSDNAILTNNGEIEWKSGKPMKATITNNAGAVLKFTTTAAQNFQGTVNNAGTMTIASAVTMQGNGGEINNTGAMTVEGTLALMTTELNITAGVVECIGTIGGAKKITIDKVNAEFIKTVKDANNFINALETTGVPANYTGVRVGAALIATASPAQNVNVAVSTTKKIYLAADLELSAAESSSLGSVIVTGDAELTAFTASTINDITINSGAKLTIGENSIFNITKGIVNNGTYTEDSGVVVTVNGDEGISGAGTWDSYPVY